MEGLENAQEYELTQLQYATPEKGGIFRLYLYGADGLHSGGKFFSSDPAKDLEMDVVTASALEMMNRNQGLETRVTDGGDMLVFHSKDGQIVYPPNVTGGDFWRTL